MYYLEYSNVELTDKLKELQNYKNDLQKILFEEKLQSNKYEFQMQEYKNQQVDSKDALERTKNSNTAIKQMIENSKFLISRMYRENNFVEKLRWLKTLMAKLDSSFTQMQSNKTFRDKYLENKGEQIEMSENQVESKIELRYFNTIKGILERENNFVNNKINTYNTISKKTDKVIEFQNTKFTKDENFLLNN